VERRQTTVLRFFLFVLGGIAFLLAGCASQNREQSPVEQGKYLVMAGGCGDCHSPKVFTAAGPAPDSAKLLSGYSSGAKLPEIPKGIIGPDQWGALTTNDMTAWVGPWGVSFASNLTPHPATGLGNWSEGLFLQALKNGKLMGTSRDILPPMPWQQIGKMKDEDLKAIFAYLRSLPPIDNAIPAPLPPSQP
jgi:mono/diheme cytochrome c family protein